MALETAHMSHGEIEGLLQKFSDDSGRARRRQADRVRNPKQRKKAESSNKGFGS